MQTTIKPVLSTYVNDNGTLFCLVYKNRNVEKSLPIDLFYLTYEDEKTAREAADMLFSDIDVRNEIIEKAEKRYKIEKEEKSFQRNGWSRKKALRRNLKKDFRKVCDWYLHIPFDDDFENGKEVFLLNGTLLKFISYQVMSVNENFRI